MQVASIKFPEIENLSRLLTFTSGDASSPMSWIALHTRNGRRHWTATDGFSMFSIASEFDSGEYSALVSTAQICAAHFGAGLAGEVSIHLLEDDGEPVTVVKADSFVMSEHTPKATHPAVVFDVETVSFGASAHFTGSELRAVITASSYAIEDSGEDSSDACLVPVTLDHGKLTVFRNDSCDETSVVSSRPGSTGCVSVRLSICRLNELVSHFSPSEDILVKFPLFERDPILLVGDVFTVAVTPAYTDRQHNEFHVERVISDTLGPLAVQRNENGEFSLCRKTAEVFGSFISVGHTQKLRVYGVAIEAIAPSSQLFEELNQINLNSDFVKLVYVDLRVIACHDLLASTVDAESLRNAIENVRNAVKNHGQMLSVVFGGDSVLPPEQLRWRKALGLVVDCEVSPGRVVDLNGADAVAEWPFPSDAYVLTGYRPQGIEIDGQAINSKLARDVLEFGGRCAVGSINNPEDNSNYPAIVTWNLSLEHARELGRKAGHDILIGLTADALTVYSCTNQSQESCARVPAVPPICH
jgi:hypothetical protein